MKYHIFELYRYWTLLTEQMTKYKLFEIHVVRKRVQRWLKRVSYYAISGHFGQINRTVRTFWLICYLYLTKYGLHYQFVPPSSFTKFRTRFHFKNVLVRFWTRTNSYKMSHLTQMILEAVVSMSRDRNTCTVCLNIYNIKIMIHVLYRM